MYVLRLLFNNWKGLSLIASLRKRGSKKFQVNRWTLLSSFLPNISQEGKHSTNVNESVVNFCHKIFTEFKQSINFILKTTSPKRTYIFTPTQKKYVNHSPIQILWKQQSQETLGKHKGFKRYWLYQLPVCLLHPPSSPILIGLLVLLLQVSFNFFDTIMFCQLYGC